MYRARKIHDTRELSVDPHYSSAGANSLARSRSPLPRGHFSLPWRIYPFREGVDAEIVRAVG